MNVITMKINSVKPYENNPRNNDDAVEATANSIKEFGWQQPIVVDKNNVVIAGHTRLKAAEQLGLAEVPVVVADNLTDEQVMAYRLADNKTSELADWDLDLLDDELSAIVDIDMGQLGFNQDSDANDLNYEDEKYTSKVDVPQYEVTGAQPDLEDLVDTSKSKQLISQIEDADVPQNVKEFLKLAAYRHNKFDYGNIAEFYVHQPKKIQKLFEDSALVIIDYDDAIAGGYAQLKEFIDEDIGEK